ncbi:MAG: universal stress protein [Rhodocyclaceae bacterium]|nr:universal stress protein [Rhodocyclaceae bacterium]
MSAPVTPLKLLVAIDGKPPGEVAARFVVRLLAAGLDAEVHLLNVQPVVESGHLRMFVSADELQGWYREEGLAALAGARAIFEAASVVATPHVAVGHAAETIERFAIEKAADLLVIGAGTPALSGLLLGSVASPLLKGSGIPVLVAR